MIELVLRLVFSLAVVVGMIMLLARFSSRRFRGSSDALIRVVQRQPLSRTSAVAVVTVGSRVLVVGTTEQQVQLLAELEPYELELDEPDPDSDDTDEDTGPDAGFDTRSDTGLGTGVAGELEPAPRRTPLTVARLGRSDAQGERSRAAARAAGRHAMAADSALAGSLLSARTWRQALAAATGTMQDAS